VLRDSVVRGKLARDFFCVSTRHRQFFFHAARAWLDASPQGGAERRIKPVAAAAASRRHLSRRTDAIEGTLPSAALQRARRLNA
jgi:hypothetical protein